MVSCLSHQCRHANETNKKQIAKDESRNFEIPLMIGDGVTYSFEKPFG